MGGPPVYIANVYLVVSITRHREIAIHLNFTYNGGHVFETAAADGEVTFVPEIFANPLHR
jgi:hypothetical protein